MRWMFVLLLAAAVACGTACGSSGSSGSGDSEAAPAEVTANNFAELAVASAEAIRGAWLAESLSIEIAKQAFGLKQIPAGAGDETTYRYTGNTFTQVSAGGPHADQFVTVSMTTGEPIAPNSTNFMAPDIVAFSVADGVSVLTQVNATGFVARFTTDAAGKIIDWAVDARRDPDVFSLGDIFIRTCNPGATITVTGSAPDGGDCDPSDAEPIVDSGTQGGIVFQPSGRVSASPGFWTTDKLCVAGTSNLVEDASNPQRYEINFVGCMLRLQNRMCTVDGTLHVEEGTLGDPLVADGIALQADCADVGLIDLDESRLSCDYAASGAPSFENLTCAVGVPKIRGAVSGRDLGTGELETSGPVTDVEASGKFVDPAHGEIAFEAIDLDLRCPDGIPNSGRIGGGGEFGTAPQFQAVFDFSCDEFAVCFLETQEDLDNLQCSATSIVTWADVGLA